MGMVTVEGWRLTCFQISGPIFARKAVMRGLKLASQMIAGCVPSGAKALE